MFSSAVSLETQIVLDFQKIYHPFYNEFYRCKTSEVLEEIKDKLLKSFESFIANISNEKQLDTIKNYLNTNMIKELMRKKDPSSIYYVDDHAYKNKLLKIISDRKSDLQSQHQLQTTAPSV